MSCPKLVRWCEEETYKGAMLECKTINTYENQQNSNKAHLNAPDLIQAHQYCGRVNHV